MVTRDRTATWPRSTCAPTSATVGRGHLYRATAICECRAPESDDIPLPCRPWRVQSRLLQVPRGLVWARLRLPAGGRGGRAGAGAKQALAAATHRDAGIARPGAQCHPLAAPHLGVRDALGLQRPPDAVQIVQVRGQGRVAGSTPPPLSARLFRLLHPLTPAPDPAQALRSASQIRS